MYFIVKQKVDRIVDGKQKTVREQYLFDALSYTEAEARAIEELAPYVSGDVIIDAITKTRIAELFNVESEADKWYNVKVAFITLDEKQGVEKKTISTMLVRANDFDEALQMFKDGMRETLADYEIVGISETQILEYFPARVG